MEPTHRYFSVVNISNYSQHHIKAKMSVAFHLASISYYLQRHNEPYIYHHRTQQELYFELSNVTNNLSTSHT